MASIKLSQEANFTIRMTFEVVFIYEFMLNVSFGHIVSGSFIYLFIFLDE